MWDSDDDDDNDDEDDDYGNCRIAKQNDRDVNDDDGNDSKVTDDDPDSSVLRHALWVQAVLHQ